MLNTGIFPEHLKISKAVPLYKANGQKLLTNYRPIVIVQYQKYLNIPYLNSC